MRGRNARWSIKSVGTECHFMVPDLRTAVMRWVGGCGVVGQDGVCRWEGRSGM